MRGYNRDYALRDGMLFGGYEKDRYSGGIRRFGCSFDTLKRLVELDFAKKSERQNDSPSIGSLLKYAERCKDSVRFGGYAVSPEREDYRIGIDEIEITIKTGDKETLSYFVTKLHDADEFSLDPSFDGYELRAWWD